MMAIRIVVNGNRIEYDDKMNRYDGRDWTAFTKGLLKAEMARRGVTYKGLVEKLAEIGVSETEANLRNKVSRGGFTASFFIQCLTAIGATALRLDD